MSMIDDSPSLLFFIIFMVVSFITIVSPNVYFFISVTVFGILSPIFIKGKLVVPFAIICFILLILTLCMIKCLYKQRYGLEKIPLKTNLQQQYYIFRVRILDNFFKAMQWLGVSIYKDLELAKVNVENNSLSLMFEPTNIKTKKVFMFYKNETHRLLWIDLSNFKWYTPDGVSEDATILQGSVSLFSTFYEGSYFNKDLLPETAYFLGIDSKTSKLYIIHEKDRSSLPNDINIFGFSRISIICDKKQLLYLQ